MDPAGIIPRSFKSVEITTTKIEDREIQKYDKTSFENSEMKVLEEK